VWINNCPASAIEFDGYVSYYLDMDYCLFVFLFDVGFVFGGGIIRPSYILGIYLNSV